MNRCSSLLACCSLALAFTAQAAAQCGIPDPAVDCITAAPEDCECGGLSGCYNSQRAPFGGPITYAADFCGFELETIQQPCFRRRPCLNSAGKNNGRCDPPFPPVCTTDNNNWEEVGTQTIYVILGLCGDFDPELCDPMME